MYVCMYVCMEQNKIILHFPLFHPCVHEYKLAPEICMGIDDMCVHCTCSSSEYLLTYLLKNIYSMCVMICLLIVGIKNSTKVNK